jgi:replication-associated recombination protein RarA
MDLKRKLLWEKYRPQTLKQMILLPRIERLITNGITSNMIFYGTSGLGKTTLASILSKDHNSLKIKKNIGVDVLRTKILDHCKALDLSSTGYKVVYIDEFDRASTQVQDELKSFIEDYSDNVRFIFTTNHIHNIEDELKSRFDEICFDPMSAEEREFLYSNQVKYLRAIAKKENNEIYKDVNVFENIVNKNFPDLRRSVQVLDKILLNSEVTVDTASLSDEAGLFKFIMEGNTNPHVNYDFVMNNYFINFDNAFKYLSRPFISYLQQYHMEIFINKGGAIFDIQTKFNETYENTLDPIIHLVNYIIKIKTAIK